MQMLKNTKMKSAFHKIIILAVWLCIWQTASLLTGLDLLLAGPVDVFRALCTMLRTAVFYGVIGSSFIKITSGFLTAFVLACILGLLSGHCHMLAQFLKPPVQLMKALPVTSFIILLLIWFGSANVAVWISGIVVFPVIYTAVLEGMLNRDLKLQEMAYVFGVRRFKKLRCIDLPQLTPFVVSGLRTSLGFCWKAGVSAEVIGLVRNSVGEQLYFAKLYLMTADLFAWSLVVVVVSFLFEQLFLYVLQKLSGWLARVSLLDRGMNVRV